MVYMGKPEREVIVPLPTFFLSPFSDNYVSGMLEVDVLDGEAGVVKGEDQGNSHLGVHRFLEQN